MPDPALPAAFAAALAGFGSFEARPHLAVAVSGGADSLALTLLAADWAAARGGHVTALTVDHGLRPESAAEAARVEALLQGRGIDHHILRWSEARSGPGLQARARAARYRLLEDWVAARGVLHLLTGHTVNDQAETFLLRLRRQSGLQGLAGIGALVERPWGRILRPLLGVGHGALCGFLQDSGVPWIEDPSNHDPRFARSGLRHEITQAGAVLPLAGLARRLGALRQAEDRLLVRALAQMVRHDTSGLTVPAVLLARPDAAVVATLARLCLAVGGRPWPPGVPALRRAVAHLRGGRATTLGGCRLIPWPNGIKILREGRRRGPRAAGGTGAETPPLGPPVFRLVSPSGGPMYSRTDSDSDQGPCMLGPPSPAAVRPAMGTSGEV